MKTIHLVRHGEVLNPDHLVYGDLPGFRLSDVGRREAEAAGDYLAGVRIDVVVSSPLDRALETAASIARQHHLDVTSAPGLGEARMYPDWTGHRWEDIPERFPGQLEQYLADATLSTGTHETVQGMARRMQKAIDGMLTERTDHLVVVSHQDTIQAYRLLVTGRDPSELRLDPPAHCEVITLEGVPNEWRESARWQPAGVDS